MRYIFIIFILYINLINLNAEVYNVFSNNNNIYYSSLNNIYGGFILSGFSMRNTNDLEISELFSPAIANFINYDGLSYSKDVKYIDGASTGKAVLLPNGKSFVKIDNKGYFYSRENSVNSFTIEFYLNPYQIRMNSKVLSKTAIYDDGERSKYAGIRANIIDGKLIWELDNLFMYNGEYSNITLSKGESLKPNEWRHHSVSFDAKTGKLVKYIDGFEEEVLYLTSSGDINGSPYTLDINKIIYEPLYLGQGFIGGIDSFSFTPNFKRNFDLHKYLKEGELISKVIDLKDSNIFIDSINCSANISNGTYIDIYYRISDSYFLPEDNFIEWRSLENINDIISAKGRYIQIRASLKSNGERNVSPILNDIEIVYHKGKSPQKPVNLTATAVNNSVILRWEGSHETITGYKIYYGEESGIYNMAGNEPIITGNQNEYVINGLKNGEIYYFSVTAIGGEGGNIESGFSEEVFARTSY